MFSSDDFLMRVIKFLFICFFFTLSLHAESVQVASVTQDGSVIRMNVGVSFPNHEGTGESAWYSPIDKNSSGFQYGIDFLHYRKNVGYGIAFRHYMHDIPIMWGTQGSYQDEDVRLFYLAPQFSYAEDGLLFKGLVNNVDFGFGYAHYLSKGYFCGIHSYSMPLSGLGAHINLGFEYRIGIHWGVRLGLSVEYYFFKNTHVETAFSDSPFIVRPKLNILMPSTQIGFSWYL